MRKNIQKNHKKEKEVEVLKSQLARALADYDNLRKRVEKEREELIKFASLSLFEKLMPVFDMLNQAQKHLNDDGLKGVVGELKRVLKEEGIVEISVSPGEEFNENFHEAIEVEKPKEKEKKGKIAEVFLNGWMLEGGKVIRPAKVKVYGEKVDNSYKLEKEITRGDYV